MSERHEVSDNGGCMLVIGIVIIAIAVGNIWSAAYGWLVLGASFVVLGLVCVAGNVVAILTRHRRGME